MYALRFAFYRYAINFSRYLLGMAFCSWIVFLMFSIGIFTQGEKFTGSVYELVLQVAVVEWMVLTVAAVAIRYFLDFPWDFFAGLIVVAFGSVLLWRVALQLFPEGWILYSGGIAASVFVYAVSISFFALVMISKPPRMAYATLPGDPKKYVKPDELYNTWLDLGYISPGPLNPLGRPMSFPAAFIALGAEKDRDDERKWMVSREGVRFYYTDGSII